MTDARRRPGAPQRERRHPRLPRRGHPPRAASRSSPPSTSPQATPAGRPFRVVGGPARLGSRPRPQRRGHPRARTPSTTGCGPSGSRRNFGQHAATLAGMTSSGGDWIVTMDEDGQQDPAFIGPMLDAAYETGRAARLRPAHEPAAARRAAQRRLQGGQGHLRPVPRRPEVRGVQQLPPRARRGRPQRRRLHRHRRLPRRRAVVGRGRRHDLPGDRARRGPAGRQLQLRPAVLPLRPARRLVRHQAAVLRLLHRHRLRHPRRARRAVGRLRAHRRRPAGQRLGLDVHRAHGRRAARSCCRSGIIAQYIGAATNMCLGKPLYVVVRDPAGTFGDPDGRRP